MTKRLLALSALLVLASIVAIAQEPAGLAAFDGQWRFSGGQRETQQQSDAIDTVVNQMNMLVREFARGEIHRRVPIDHRLRIAMHGTTGFALTIEDWGPIDVPLDGSYRDARGDEDQAVRVSANFAGGRITEHQVTDQGGRTNVFVMDDQNRRLTMWVRIHSDQLPADIVYHLSYRHPS